MSRRVALIDGVVAVLVALAALLGGESGVASAGEAWRFEPASAPPPPAGVAPAAYPVPLGRVGDIEFWAPNRGLLITGGSSEATPVVPPGVYAYDGVSWHQLSTVCGGAEGRIVWAGPDEFWTISDERSFQLSAGFNEYANLSLCHFENGEVVGSYAEPFNQPNSYQKMFAGACLSPGNCWFGGALGEPPNSGAFHLHWDGHSITVVYTPQGHAIASMALAGPNQLYESVQLVATDNFGGESQTQPSLLHQVDFPGAGALFANAFLPNSACAGQSVCPPLPDYGTDPQGRPVSPLTLGPFKLASNYSLGPVSSGESQLWAAATPFAKPPEIKSSEGLAHPLVLRYSAGGWRLVVGTDAPGGGGLFESEPPSGIASEKGSPNAWVSTELNDNEAHVDLLTAEGTIVQRERLGRAQGVGQRGNAGPISCPAPHDCWLATDRGWLFHLTDGSTWPQDTDPNFAGVITYRPSDPSVPQLPPDQPPIDDSLANQTLAPPPPPPPPVQEQLINLPVVLDLRSHLLARDTLQLTFKLAAKAHVQLFARRRGQVVAKTRRQLLNTGKHKIELRLNPHRWPTKLDLKATPLHPYTGPAPQGGGAENKPVSQNSVGT